MDETITMLEKSKYFIKLPYNDIGKFSEIAALNGVDPGSIKVYPDFSGMSTLGVYITDEELNFLKLSTPYATFFNYTRTWAKQQKKDLT